jgi:hypothetical protein
MLFKQSNNIYSQALWDVGGSVCVCGVWLLFSISCGAGAQLTQEEESNARTARAQQA